jgi:hypothetical protein
MSSSTPDNVPTPIAAEQNAAMPLDTGASASVPSEATESGEPAQVFNFFGLSRELRDMIYDQPCLLGNKLLMGRSDPRPRDSFFDDLYRHDRMVATKPRVNMRLVSRRFAQEYNERCDGQNKIFVRATAETWDIGLWPNDIAMDLNVLHLHWGEFDLEDDADKTLSCLQDIKDQVIDICRHLPSLRTVHLKLYMGNFTTKLDAFEAWLGEMVSIPKMEHLKIISCDHPAKCWDLSSRKYVLVDWKSGQPEAPTAITGRASAVEYAESCCDGLSYDGPRVGEVAWDEYGNYLGQIGEDREVFMPIPNEYLFDAGLHYGEGEGISPDLLRAAGLGWWLDGFQAEDDENDADSDPPVVSSGSSRSDIASWVEHADMSGVEPDADSAEENNETDNSNSVSQFNDNSMERYFYYANMDGAMDAFEDHNSRVEVAETDAVVLATHDEVKESDENVAKPFGFFSLSRELRDMIYAQPGMTQDEVIGEDDFDLDYGTGNKVRVAITKPRENLCLVSKQFGAEYIKVCEDREELFIRTSHFVHNEGDTKMWSDADIKQVKFLKFHMGDWCFGGSHPDHSRTPASVRALADLENLERWLKDLCVQMPCLRAVSFKLYVTSMHLIGKDLFEGWLRSMAAFDNIEQLKVVEFTYGPGDLDDFCWDLRAKHQLLLHWRAGDIEEPTIIDSAPVYTESCCDGLEYGEKDWDGEPDWDYDGNYIGDDETLKGSTYY